ncbi:uncharacterized protein LOC113330739 [Papaver somniferum]|uniref:uncharacterized protein LOC113330739 n=1 Tax=Papaver somniferum TaxID=3469 RepID=UPI000E703FA1|nr:uncharacterized protein LOC113330739 [Papaver somniferum]
MEERKYICANGLDSRYLTVVRFCKVRWYGTYPVWSHVCLVICVCKLEFGIDGLIGFPGSRLGSKQKSFGDIFIAQTEEHMVSWVRLPQIALLFEQASVLPVEAHIVGLQQKILSWTRISEKLFRNLFLRDITSIVFASIFLVSSSSYF